MVLFNDGWNVMKLYIMDRHGMNWTRVECNGREGEGEGRGRRKWQRTEGNAREWTVVEGHGKE